MLSQNLILMGIFFSIPLYLQIVLGLDALETGIKMLPVSIAMFITSAVGLPPVDPVPGPVDRPGRPVDHRSSPPSPCWPRSSPRWPTAPSRCRMAVLGVGMGLIVSQLGNVVQSSVDASGRGEAGGLQYTGQQLGSSLGVALIGSIVLIGLTSAFVSNIQDDPRISAEVVETQIERRRSEEGIDFVASDQVEAAAQDGRRSTRPRPRRSSTTTRTPSSRRSRPACWRRRSWPCSPSRSPVTCPTTRRPANEDAPDDAEEPVPA